jgi:hypothetical protein
MIILGSPLEIDYRCHATSIITIGCLMPDRAGLTIDSRASQCGVHPGNPSNRCEPTRVSIYMSIRPRVCAQEGNAG